MKKQKIYYESPYARTFEYNKKHYKQINFLVKPNLYDRFMRIWQTSGLTKNELLDKLLDCLQKG